MDNFRLKKIMKNKLLTNCLNKKNHILKEEFCINYKKYKNLLSIRMKKSKQDYYAVFLTHVGIWQMSTWLPTWKAKSLCHVGTFLPMWFFLLLQKFKTIKIKPEKNPYTQTNTFLLHISRDFNDILFSNIHALLFIFSKL